MSATGSKIVKCRKPHVCGYCDMAIKPGEMAAFYEGRVARTGEDDKQIGIQYYKQWLHAELETCETLNPVLFGGRDA